MGTVASSKQRIIKPPAVLVPFAAVCLPGPSNYQIPNKVWLEAINYLSPCTDIPVPATRDWTRRKLKFETKTPSTCVFPINNNSLQTSSSFRLCASLLFSSCHCNTSPRDDVLRFNRCDLSPSAPSPSIQSIATLFSRYPPRNPNNEQAIGHGATFTGDCR